jgi:WXG100 family type VII secretion target
MAASTVNVQKMKSVASELDKIYASMTNNKKKLDETIAALQKVWAGEGSAAYQAAYRENSQDFALLAEAIRGCSATLNTSAVTYSKADTAAADAIKSKLARG